jgi:hypothetical protein
MLLGLDAARRALEAHAAANVARDSTSARLSGCQARREPLTLLRDERPLEARPGPATAPRRRRGRGQVTLVCVRNKQLKVGAANPVVLPHQPRLHRGINHLDPHQRHGNSALKQALDVHRSRIEAIRRMAIPPVFFSPRPSRWQSEGGCQVRRDRACSAPRARRAAGHLGSVALQLSLRYGDSRPRVLAGRRRRPPCRWPVRCRGRPAATRRLERS